ncbi:MAG: family 10 glycosylhydrolase [Acidobacteria bacterium]|nr:family 10 glycosylhydrolase [Acidobacteriota bacterium]
MSTYPAFCSRLIVALLFLSGCALADPAEVRGVWIDRSSLVSREEIRVTMRQLSESNFNLVLVNVWSRGYPLWQSRVFEKETGMLTDPGYAGRDVLKEVIEEASAIRTGSNAVGGIRFHRRVQRIFSGAGRSRADL